MLHHLIKDKKGRNIIFMRDAPDTDLAEYPAERLSGKSKGLK
jgi:hypothetical protein